MTCESIPELLDKSVESIVPKRWHDKTIRRRPMRYVPIIFILMGAAGLGIELDGRYRYWGYGVVMITVLLSAWPAMLGPVKPFLLWLDVDEFDRNLRARANLASMFCMVLFALFVLMSIPLVASLKHWSASELVWPMISAGMYMMVLWNSLPGLFASWMIPNDRTDDES